MSNQNQDFSGLLHLLQKVEIDIKKARLILQNISEGKGGEISDEDVNSITKLTDGLTGGSKNDGDITIIEGVYDGYFMIGSDKKKYPVPLNYSSKTKLIPGDVLKLRIMQDGKLIYKLIVQAGRKYEKAVLSKSDDHKYIAISDEGTTFFLNQAAVSYFKGKTGDELSIIVNVDGIGNFAAIEALIPQVK